MFGPVRLVAALFAFLAWSTPALAQLTTGDEQPPPSARSREDSKPHRRPADTWSQFDSAVAGDDKGVPASHPSVQPVLAQHPDRDLILCLAGCGGSIKVVSLRPHLAGVVAASLGESVPTSAKAGQAKGPQPASKAMSPGESFDVICVAGCNGAPGEIVGRNVRLSWINEQGSEALKAALRRIAERIGRGEPTPEEPALRSFMTDRARAALIEASTSRLETFASLPAR